MRIDPELRRVLERADRALTKSTELMQRQHDELVRLSSEMHGLRAGAICLAVIAVDAGMDIATAANLAGASVFTLNRLVKDKEAPRAR